MSDIERKRDERMHQRKSSTGDFAPPSRNGWVRDVPWEGKAFVVEVLQDGLVTVRPPDCGAYPLESATAEALAWALLSAAKEAMK